MKVTHSSLFEGDMGSPTVKTEEPGFLSLLSSFMHPFKQGRFCLVATSMSGFPKYHTSHTVGIINGSHWFKTVRKYCACFLKIVI